METGIWAMASPRRRVIAGWPALMIVLSACTSFPAGTSGGSAPIWVPMDPGMMARHMAPLPAEYAGLTNPIPADADSLARGEQIFQESCAVCHGEQGWGDGPAAEALDPAPAPLAHTAGMLSDAYLFYRISEGGGFPPFDSAMPAFKESLSANERWDTVNYLRHLADEGGMTGRGMMGESMYGGMGDMMGGMLLGWMMLFGVLLLVLLVGTAALVVVLLARRSGDGEVLGTSAAGQSTGAESPLDILKRRYAAGEIDAEQFR